MKRLDQSTFLDNLLSMEKKAFGIERISDGIRKEDPFEKYANEEFWFIKNGKLYRKRKRK